MTENNLKSIAIVGSGVYGSYIASRLAGQPGIALTIFEIGNHKPVSDTHFQLGAETINENYSGASKGRFFGLGGTSSKWGGKILFFDKNSFHGADNFLKQIVGLNVKYSKLVKSFLKIKSGETKKITAKNSTYRLEYGNWLLPFRKNFFKSFGLSKVKDIKVFKDTRVLKLINKDFGTKVIYKQDGRVKESDFSFVFLCSGAFECARILAHSGLEESRLRFSDHVGIQFGESSGPMAFFGFDFSYQISKLSLRTRRISSEFRNKSYYIHPIIDMNSGLLKLLKKVVKEDFKTRDILAWLKYSFMEMFWLLRCVISRKLLPPNNKWRLNMTIENIDRCNFINFKKIKDGSLILEINYRVSDELKKDIKKIINNFKLDSNDSKIKYFDKSKFDNYEDVYHPFGLFQFHDLNHFKNKYGKIICFSTAILPRSGSINPTGAILPVIEHILNERPWNE